MRRELGFTLLEVMIVVLIIGVMASFAVLSIGSRALDDRLDTEARRLQQLMSLAADEAVLQGVELGFRQTADGYEFLFIDPNQTGATPVWTPVPDDPALRSRRLEDPFYLELQVENRPVAPPGPDKEGESPLPQVLLSSSGEVTAFSIRIRARDYPAWFQLESNVLGQMKLERKGAS